MADMVLLRCAAGSKAATVLCPKCGRISRQILAGSYKTSQVSALIRPHVCPVCHTVYKDSNPSQSKNWSSELRQYDQNADAYNQSAKEKHALNNNDNNSNTSQFRSAKTSRIGKTPIPLDKYWYCDVDIPGIPKRYMYISDFGMIRIDTKVVVPYGSEGQERIGTVSACQAFEEDRVPCPIHLTKHILRVATRDDLRSKEKTTSLLVAMNKNNSTESSSSRNTEQSIEDAQTHFETTRAASASVEKVLEPNENLDRKIDRWKRELLDTGKRNRMINFRETKRSTLRILEPEASELFNRLAFSEKPLTFQKPINKDTDLRTYSMIALMETLSYNLNVQRGDIKTADTIIEREKTLRNLRAKAKLAQDEQGINILYLCFGFIYWREHNRESSLWFKAPLLMMPVSLGLKSLKAPYTLSRYDDEIEVNPTLDYLFNTEYNIDLPTFDLKNKDSFEEYLTQIEEIVDKRGWKVEREVSLGLLSFLKISMYHDLSNHRHLMANHPVIRAMAGDREALTEPPDGAEHFDFDSVKPEDWHEVINADSSQEDAILLSKLGISFVMQGPPGTGKSQTITNIIAEALADGKKVLFVSEKAAALQVVLKRLTEAHLDDFCLSLHSYKANKKEIVQSIGANLNLKDTYVDRSAMSELTELFHDREFLNAYAKELHEMIEPLGQSVYMAFGRLENLDSATVLEFSFTHPESVSREDYASILYCVSAFEKALHNMDSRLSENPWFGTNAISAGQIFKQELQKQTEGLSDDLFRIAELSEAIDAQIGTGNHSSFFDASTLLDITDVLTDHPVCINRAWFDTQTLEQRKNQLREARRHSDQLHQLENTVLADWEESVRSIDVEDVRRHFLADLSWTFDINGNVPIEKRISDAKSAAEQLKQKIEDFLAVYHEGCALLSLSQCASVDNARIVASVLSLAVQAPTLANSWFDARRTATIEPLLDEAIHHSTSIATLTTDILGNWEQSAFEIDAEGMLARFKTEYVGMLHTLKSGYKEDMKTLRAHYKSVGGKIDESIAIAFLQKVRDIKAEKTWFDDHAEAFSAVLGEQYHGDATDWDRIRDGFSRAKEIADVFPFSAIPEKTIDAVIAITQSLQLSGSAQRISAGLSSETFESLESLIRESRYIQCFSSDCDLSNTILVQTQSFIETCEKQISFSANLAALKKEPPVLYTDVVDLLSNLDLINEERNWFSEHNALLRDLISDNYSADMINWSDLVAAVKTVERACQLFAGNVPSPVIEMLCSSEGMTLTLQSLTLELQELVSAAKPKLTAFAEQFKSEDFISADLTSVAVRYETCMKSFDALNKWLDYSETRDDCNRHGLASFTAAIALHDNAIEDVSDAFERGFCTQWLNAQLDKLPAVQSFRRRVHEQRVERFVELDTKQFEITRQVIRDRIVRTYPSINSIAKSGSELAILRHEMEKKQRIMPVRQLFHKIPNLLLTLKPCLMMSPLSVAYFLEAENYHFDMVIFDEASQIFPQDAIGAIFRADQVVIAGDTKQLPPTNFFSSSTSNGNDGYDDDDKYEEEIYDSILEETASILPSRMLLWHYRSKHEHLIAFSNQEIYKNELVTFPSSSENEPDKGVEFIFVEDGYYEPSPKNNNIPEAKRIVGLVKEHIEQHPDRSLGIIAFSEKQQQTIALEIQRFREKNPEYEAFFAEDKEDEFFVKNLENVQGDERDTIIFSIGYAKTKEQKSAGRPMSLRFGPLGVSGGERRLNVAITRAKINIKLVSSILPSDIDLSRTESEGIRMLRSYIEFAMNGKASLASSQINHRTDDFADAIARHIRDHGYKVSQYVGCSGYKIDIAVEHPSEAVKQYVAGIECDGFSYTSARTARDRDRLRSSVLNSMGWNLYRVWSAEWYRNPEIEGQKLIAFVEHAIKECDARIAELQAQKREREEVNREEIEKARIERELEEQKKQRERDAAERERRTAREEADRKRREQKKREKAEQSPPRVKQTSNTRVATTSQVPEWARVGVSVFHKTFRLFGMISEINEKLVTVNFANDEKEFRVFAIPQVFTNGILVQATEEVKRQEAARQKVQKESEKAGKAACEETDRSHKEAVEKKQTNREANQTGTNPKSERRSTSSMRVPEWAQVGASVYHKTFSIGIITPAIK